MEKVFDEVHIAVSQHCGEASDLGEGDTHCRSRGPSGSPVRTPNIPWNTRARKPSDSSLRFTGTGGFRCQTPCRLNFLCGVCFPGRLPHCRADEREPYG